MKDWAHKSVTKRKMKTNNPTIVYRIFEPIRRVGGGSMQRYHCIINDRRCQGFMCEMKRGGKKTKQTCFGLEVVEGWDWHWLAAKNGRHFKKPV